MPRPLAIFHGIAFSVTSTAGCVSCQNETFVGFKTGWVPEFSPPPNFHATLPILQVHCGHLRSPATFSTTCAINCNRKMAKQSTSNATGVWPIQDSECLNQFPPSNPTVQPPFQNPRSTRLCQPQRVASEVSEIVWPKVQDKGSWMHCKKL